MIFVIKSLIFEAMYLFIPKISLKHNHGPKWFDSSIRHHLKCLRTLRRKQKANPSVQKQRNIEISEKELNFKMESSKLNYERNLLESLQSNHSSSIYAYMRSITGHNSIPEIVSYNGTILLSVMRIRLHYLTTTFIRCSLLVILFFHQ